MTETAFVDCKFAWSLYNQSPFQAITSISLVEEKYYLIIPDTYETHSPPVSSAHG